MERFTISLDDDLAHQFDTHMAQRGYATRSEAVRDLIRRELEQSRIIEDSGDCVGTVSYVYSHRERTLAGRLTQMQHDRHDLVIALAHVHLNHEDCIETLFVKGQTSSVRALAQSIIAERGVRHGTFHLLSLMDAGHDHMHIVEDGETHPHGHKELPT